MKKIPRLVYLVLMVGAALTIALALNTPLNSSRAHAAVSAAPFTPFENAFDLCGPSASKRSRHATSTARCRHVPLTCHRFNGLFRAIISRIFFNQARAKTNSVARIASPSAIVTSPGPGSTSKATPIKITVKPITPITIRLSHAGFSFRMREIRFKQFLGSQGLRHGLQICRRSAAVPNVTRKRRPNSDP
jgi:hypothetical protein